MEFNPYPSQFYDYNVHGYLPSLHWCSRCPSSTKWVSTSLPLPPPSYQQVYPTPPSPSNTSFLSPVQIDMISTSINTIQQRVMKMKETNSRMLSSLSQVRSHLHEMQLDDEKTEEATVEDVTANVEIVWFFEGESELIEENSSSLDISQSLDANSALEVQVLDESSQRPTSEYLNSFVTGALLPLTVGNRAKFDIEFGHKVFDLMSNWELFENFYGPDTVIASFPHNFASHDSKWVDTGQVGGSLYLDVWLFHEFKMAVKCKDDSSCEICIYEGDYALVVANSCVADISELKTEYVGDYSRNFACKVFPEISNREIAMEIEDSANGDSVQTITQLFDVMFQPFSVVKYGSEVREDKANDYKHHSTLLGSPSKLFEIEFHVPIIDFPFDPGSAARLVLDSAALVLDNSFPWNLPCIALGVMSTTKIGENPTVPIAGQSFKEKKQRCCFSEGFLKVIGCANFGTHTTELHAATGSGCFLNHVSTIQALYVLHMSFFHVITVVNPSLDDFTGVPLHSIYMDTLSHVAGIEFVLKDGHLSPDGSFAIPHSLAHSEITVTAAFYYNNLVFGCRVRGMKFKMETQESHYIVVPFVLLMSSLNIEEAQNSSGSCTENSRIWQAIEFLSLLTFSTSLFQHNAIVVSRPVMEASHSAFKLYISQLLSRFEIGGADMQIQLLTFPEDVVMTRHAAKQLLCFVTYLKHCNKLLQVDRNLDDSSSFHHIIAMTTRNDKNVAQLQLWQVPVLSFPEKVHSIIIDTDYSLIGVMADTADGNCNAPEPFDEKHIDCKLVYASFTGVLIIPGTITQLDHIDMNYIHIADRFLKMDCENHQNKVFLLGKQADHYNYKGVVCYSTLLTSPFSDQFIRAAAVIPKIAWTRAANNLLLYMFAGHVLGAFWYLLPVKRDATCGKIGCNCNPSNSTIFNFRILANAVTYNVIFCEFFEEHFQCLWWCLQNLNSYGQILTTSTFTWDTSFAILVQNIIHHKLNNIRRAWRKHRCRVWWLLVVAPSEVNASSAFKRYVASGVMGHENFGFVGILPSGYVSFKQITVLLASLHMDLLMMQASEVATWSLSRIENGLTLDVVEIELVLASIAALQFGYLLYNIFTVMCNPSEEKVCYTIIAMNGLVGVDPVKRILLHSLFYSNLEDKVLLKGGRIVMNDIGQQAKVEDVGRRLSNYVWDPGKIEHVHPMKSAIYTRGNSSLGLCYDVCLLFFLASLLAKSGTSLFYFFFLFGYLN